MFGRKKRKAEIEAARAELIEGIIAWRAALGDLAGKTVSDDGKTIGYGAGSMPASEFFDSLIERASAAIGGLTDEDIEKARRKAAIDAEAELAHETTAEESAAQDEETRQVMRRDRYDQSRRQEEAEELKSSSAESLTGFSQPEARSEMLEGRVTDEMLRGMYPIDDPGWQAWAAVAALAHLPGFPFESPEKVHNEHPELAQRFRRTLLIAAQASQMAAKESAAKVARELGVPVDRPDRPGWSGVCPDCGNTIRGVTYDHRPECQYFPADLRQRMGRPRWPIVLPSREDLMRHKANPELDQQLAQMREYRLRQQKIARGEESSDGLKGEVDAEGKVESSGKDNDA